jgi:photosystem II stability/assembly factor-like uncharacterized protein
MKRSIFSLLVMCSLFFTQAKAQVAINNSLAAPHSSSMLDITSTTRGLLIPRMTQDQRTGIGSPATGLMVYQTDQQAGFWFFDGAQWAKIGGGTSTTAWNISGNSGTLAGTNFIGTLDGQSLDIRTNNLLRTRITLKGQIETYNTGYSVFIGEGAGTLDDLTDNYNVFIGYQAGHANYSKQIASIRETGIGNRKTRKRWDDILVERLPAPVRNVGPLLTSTWGQGCYYNAQCPVDAAGPCSHVPTGCGPTAMTQIMKYYNFPPQGVGTHSYIHPFYGAQNVNLGEDEYDWASMPDHLNTYNLSVATLMYHTGISVNAAYTANNTNSWIDEIKEAFIDHFNFDPGILTHVKLDYPGQDEWENLLRADLDNNQPVFYWGYGPEAGHYFVCDGYNSGNGMFHFNWGWNGNNNGWYVIGALNPGGIDFNTYNAILTGIKPYNPDLIIRITEPENNTLVAAGQPVTITAEVINGDPDQIKIIDNGVMVASGNSGPLSLTWNTTMADAGSHDVRACLYSGNDSVYYRINLNICCDWIKQSSGFENAWRAVNYLSAVDSNVVWAIAREGIMEWQAPIQEFTRTTDGGNTWTAGFIPGCEGLSPGMICAMSAEKAYVTMFRLSGSNPKGVYVTEDGGITWNRQETALFESGNSFPDCIHFFDDMQGWCMGDPAPQDGAYEFEIYTTIDGGQSWTEVPSGNKPDPLSLEAGLLGYSAINDTLWFGTTHGRIYKSTDRGLNYSVTTVPSMEGHWLIPVFRNGSQGLVHDFFSYSGEGKICETFDGGNTWTEIVLTGPIYRTDLAYVPGTENTWVSTGGVREEIGKGASVSYDGGHTWTDFKGTNGAKFRNMAWINEHCGWAGSFNDNDSAGGIFKFCGDLMVGLEDEIFHVPGSGFQVSCYPNPASGIVGFRFSILDSRSVTLKIYDVQEKKVAGVLDEKLPAGEHSVRFDMSRLPSGIYIARLTAGEETAATKIIKK